MYILLTLRFSKYYDPSLEQFLDIAKRFLKYPRDSSTNILDRIPTTQTAIVHLL
jgi:hypothetical protein